MKAKVNVLAKPHPYIGICSVLATFIHKVNQDTKECTHMTKMYNSACIECTKAGKAVK